MQEGGLKREKKQWSFRKNKPEGFSQGYHENGSFHPDYGGRGQMVTITEAAAVGAVVPNVFPVCSGCQKAVESSRV